MENLKKAAKYLLTVYQKIKVFVLRIAGLIDFPVPPNWLMRSTSARTIRGFYESGIRTYIPLVTVLLLRHEDYFDQPKYILDFGCGVGRQLLHITKRYPNVRVYACDVNYKSIEWINRNFSTVSAYTNFFDPPLEYEDNFFDTIYSVSVFSHLNIEDQKEWLVELFRVTKCGGYCLITTEGEFSLEKQFSKLGLASQDRELFFDSGFFYKEYPLFKASKAAERNMIFGSSLIGIPLSYGSMFLRPEFIRKHWSELGFEVLGILPSIIDHLQDLVILRKPFDLK